MVIEGWAGGGARKREVRSHQSKRFSRVLGGSALLPGSCTLSPQRWISDVPSTDTIASTATTVPESGPPPPKALEKAIGARIDFLGYGTGAATQQWNKDQENAKKDAAAGNSITVQVKRSK